MPKRPTVASRSDFGEIGCFEQDCSHSHELGASIQNNWSLFGSPITIGYETTQRGLAALSKVKKGIFIF